MATAVVKNLFTGGLLSTLYTDRRIFYLDPQMFAELYPDATPFLTLMMNRRQRSGVSDPVFKMFQHKNPWERQYMQVNGTVTTIAAASGGASVESAAITFDTFVGLPQGIDSSFIHYMYEVWDVTGKNFKGACILITDTTSATATFRNLREVDIDVVDNDLFVFIGNAQEEGEYSPDAWADELSTVWNQCGIKRTPVEITGTLHEASLKGANDELARLRLQKMQQHKISLEKTLLHSASPLGTNLNGTGNFTKLDKLTGKNSKVIRTTYGAMAAVRDYGATTGQFQSNFDIPEATYKYSNFVDDMEKVFQYVPNSGMKFAFCGPGMMSYWSKLEGTSGFGGKSAWQIKIKMSDTQKEPTLGFNIRKLETPHGVLGLVKTHSLKYEYNNYMFIPDDSNLELVTYRADQFRANIKTDNAYDGVKDEYFSDKGCGLTIVEAHQIFKLI